MGLSAPLPENLPLPPSNRLFQQAVHIAPKVLNVSVLFVTLNIVFVQTKANSYIFSKDTEGFKLHLYSIVYIKVWD